MSLAAQMRKDGIHAYAVWGWDCRSCAAVTERLLVEIPQAWVLIVCHCCGAFLRYQIFWEMYCILMTAGVLYLRTNGVLPFS